MSHAHKKGDEKLVDEVANIMKACNTPLCFAPDYSQTQATSNNNRPTPVGPPTPQGTKVTGISDDIFYACMPEGKRKEAEPWDDSLDAKVFDSRIKPQAIKHALDGITTFAKTEHKFWFVLMMVLKHLRWLIDGVQINDFLRWASLHYKLGWKNKSELSFATINKSKDKEKNGIVKNTDVKEWKSISKEQFRDIDSYINFALLLKKAFVHFIVNDKEVDSPTEINIGKFRDRQQFLRDPQNPINTGK